MNIKPIIFKAILTTLVLSHPIAVLAGEIDLQVAIIKNSVASEDITSGNFDNSIRRLTKRNMVENTFENNMGLCVSYLKKGDTEKAENSCSAAIKSTSTMSHYNDKSRYLKSLSYSNRAVARYIKNDLDGAIEDLKTAKTIDDNTITDNNLQLMLSITSKESDFVETKVAD
jgi:hypothetical protein